MLKYIVGSVAGILLLCGVLPTTAFGLDKMETIPVASGYGVGAEAAVLIELKTGRIMFAQNENKQLPIASTTKILTALITLEQDSLDAMFTADSTAIMVEGSSMGLRQGDIVSLRALASGMLLPSGNDAANAAAVRIAGTIPDFAKLMNDKVRSLGLQNSNFETPSGLDGESHYSSAYDMAIIAQNALSNPDFVDICSQYKLRATFGNPPYERWLTNHNRLLNSVEGAFGVKTGFTKKAGRCLVSAVNRDGVSLICVTLDSPDDWSIHKQLYDIYFKQLSVEDLSDNIPTLSVPVTGGTDQNVSAVTYESAQFALPVDGCNIEYKVTLPPFLYAPVKSGQSVGYVDILMDGKQLTTLSLICEKDVPLLTPYKEPKDWLGGIKKYFASKNK